MQLHLQTQSESQPRINIQMFDNTALEAFRSAIHDHDFQPLSDLFGVEFVGLIRHVLSHR